MNLNPRQASSSLRVPRSSSTVYDTSSSKAKKQPRQYNEPQTAMMKPIAHIPTVRIRASQTLQSLHHHRHPLSIPSPVSSLVVPPRPSSFARHKTTTASPSSSSPSAKRRAVTPFNDTGQVPWSSLSIPEKAGRAAQQSFNLGVILVGVVLTVGVGYFLYTDVFSPGSKTAHFNRAVNRIKADSRCTALLGPGNELVAHGDETYNKWRRARPIQSTTKVDQYGHEHLMMHFYVEGPKNRAMVMLHLVKGSGTRGDFEYKYFYLDVPGHERIYLEGGDGTSAKSGKDKKFRLFGVSWTQ
ncbi:hypothetical protein MKZ38_005210 [Zalerion maritima]|uniref:Mitochondrial import inner membrane translocase subunit Tim21 n=1 Tax=Zalerion maritima TaxID=339359 RepID=A0AAD5RLL6_9PEZI|nr:hypothetical protein MKZ38_005210 [Zalerion maritima]